MPETYHAMRSAGILRPGSHTVCLIFASGMTGIGEESGRLSDRQLPLPEDMIGNHAEPDQKAQRRAYHQ